ncbi:MAG: SBBP repeat-containing protein, partial [Nitrososphaerales archaeon]
MKRFILPLLLFHFICKSYSQVPEELWSVTYPEPDTTYIHTEKMICDVEGNTYLTGYINENNNKDFITIKYNSNGIKLWTATYNSSYDSTDQATDIAVDASGNVYVTGRSIDGGSPNDYLTIKYNSEGVVQWTVRFNGSGSNEYFSNIYLALDSQGNVFITGTNWGNATQVWNYVTVKY